MHRRRRLGRPGKRESAGNILTRGSGLILAIALGARALAAAPAPLSPAVFDLAHAILRSRGIVQKDLVPIVPGLAVAVFVDGAVIWSEEFGYANLATKAPVAPTTRFRVGSVAKPITAAGLMLLVEAGRLDLDAPIQKYVPDYPNQGAPITTRMLAGHLSGIRHYRGLEMLSNRVYPTLREGLGIFERDPLLSRPGTSFVYSSYNWNLVGVVMESAAQEDFLSYMSRRVFVPLGLTHTRADQAGATDPDRAQPYEVDRMGRFIPAPPVDSSYKWPSGGFLSTADDLARFGAALVRPGFLKAESLQILFTSQKTSGGRPTHYGLGWFVAPGVVFHGGDSVGGTAVLLLAPAAHLAVAMACNRGHLAFSGESERRILTTPGDRFTSLPLTKAARQIAALFVAALPPQAPPSAPAAVGSKAVRKLALR